MQANLYSTIALRNPSGSLDFLRSKGVHIPSNVDATHPGVQKKIALALADYAKQTKEKGIVELAKIHPDKELFGQQEFAGQKELNLDSSKTLNCSACPRANFCADATTSKSPTILDSKTLNTAIIAATVIIAGGFLTLLIINLRK